MDDGGGNARAVAAIARIDILHHLLAPLVLEIDVDVGRLAAILGHEAREEQVMLQGVDRRDAKQEADDRIGGRSASLAQRSEEHTSELQSLMRHSYAVFCLHKKNSKHTNKQPHITTTS